MLAISITNFHDQLRETLAARNAEHQRNPRRAWTQETSFEWLIGVYTALDMVDHPLAPAVGFWVRMAVEASVEEALGASISR
jgi:hypothetical protein